MKRITLLQAIAIGGNRSANAGDTVDADDFTADAAIKRRVAVLASDVVAPVKTRVVSEVVEPVQTLSALRGSKSRVR